MFNDPNTMKKKIRTKPKKTVRVYYGWHPKPQYWVCKVSNAQNDVEIDGSLLHALKGQPGNNLACHMCYTSKENAEKFPHPFYFASFTRSTALIVSELDKRGQPSHVVRYDHSYADLVELNDKDFEKKYVKQHPEVVERTFTLRKPRHTRPFYKEPATHTRNPKPTGRRSFVHQGALRRAVDAGLMPAALESFGFK